MKEHESIDWPAELNINELAARHDLRITVSPRPSAMQIELDTRIKLEEASHKRRKDWLLFKVGVYALVTFAFLGMWLVLAASEAAQRNWALALTAMITGLFGYLSGRHKS